MVENGIYQSIKEAKEKINTRREKGIELYNIGVAVLKLQNGVSYERENDKFISMYKQWKDFTYSELRSIYSNTSIAFDFKEKRSSKVEYVSSGWVPDTKYYLSKKLVPQLDYLDILLKTIEDYKTISEESQNDDASNNDTSEDIDLRYVEKISFWTLLKNISWKSVIGFIGFIIMLIIAVSAWVYNIGYNSGLAGNKELQKASEINNSLINDLETISVENDSLKHLMQETKTK